MITDTINIAIDGPAGAGKSTVAKAIAKRMGIVYLDTGAMYRASALKAKRLGIDVADIGGVKKMLAELDIKIAYIGGEQHIFLDGIDVSNEIRHHEMSRLASDISKIPEIRLKLVEMQRKIASAASCVLDGRDTTSFVLPDAQFKFFLTATPEERAKRRYGELVLKNEDITFEQVLNDINERDYNDTHRSFAPLIKTDDSLLIDSTDLVADAVVEKIISIIEGGV